MTFYPGREDLDDVPPFDVPPGTEDADTGRRRDLYLALSVREALNLPPVQFRIDGVLPEKGAGASIGAPGDGKGVTTISLLGCTGIGEPSVVIPYANVLTWYGRELGTEQIASGRERRCGCGCGCGQRVWGRKRWAASACKQRGYRQRVGEVPNCPEKPAPLLAPTVTVSGNG